MFGPVPGRIRHEIMESTKADFAMLASFSLKNDKLEITTSYLRLYSDRIES